MDRIKRLINAYVPVTTCNLRCSYCYITQGKRWADKLPVFKYSAGQIRNALSVERLGGVCLINLCGGGETLLPPEVTPIIQALLEEGHYLEVVTNGTLSDRFHEISKFPQKLLKRLEFKFSLHYLELLRTRQLDAYFENVHRIREAGCSFTVELAPHDELVPHIDEIRSACIAGSGAICHVTVARDDGDPNIPILTNYPIQRYREIWSVLDSPLFDFKLSTFCVKRKEFCYAGDWSLFVDLGSGRARQCYKSKWGQNVFQDTGKPIRFLAIGKKCPEAHCYNSHALMTLGLIPSVPAPTYSEMRNRRCNDGTEWLSFEMKSFLSQKLYENNEEYGFKRRIESRIKNTYLYIRQLSNRILRKVVGKKKGKRHPFFSD